jgi:hypothetical protein
MPPRSRMTSRTAIDPSKAAALAERLLVLETTVSVSLPTPGIWRKLGFKVRRPAR